MLSNSQTDSLGKDILSVITSVVSRKAGLHEPEFKGNEKLYAAECLDTGWVSSVGKFVDEFERHLERFTGATRAVALVNGTSALHLSLVLCDVKPNDEVICPDLTFVAPANAISYVGAIPYFVDVDVNTFGIDAVKLRQELQQNAKIQNKECRNKKTGRRIRAIIVVHGFGHAAEMDELVKIAEEFHLVLIEDAAESLGTYYRGKHTGRFGRLGALSFNGNKIVTTGGGGALLTDDVELGARAKHISTTAKQPHPWMFRHDAVGFNYRMPNINAAIGCAQMERLPDFLSRKRSLAMRYKKAFEGVPGVLFFEEPRNSKSNYWLNVILLEKSCCAHRDVVLKTLNESGFQSRPAWTLMHKLPMFQDCPRMEAPVAEDIEARLINIPSSAFL